MKIDYFKPKWDRFVYSRGRTPNERQTNVVFEELENISDRCWLAVYKQLLDHWEYARLPFIGELKAMVAQWTSSQHVVSEKTKEPCDYCHTRGFLEYINLRFGCRCSTLCTCGHCSNGDGQNFGRKMTKNELYELGKTELHDNGFFRSEKKNEDGLHVFYNIVIESN